MNLTDRERFTALLAAQPLRSADAIVILCGEDAEGRALTGLELFKNGAAPCIVCSGAKHDPPRWVGGDAISQTLIGAGVAPDRLMVELSEHTRAQAIHVLDLAAANDWRALLLVASSYHMPRAFLTFVQRLEETDALNRIRLVPVDCRSLPWFQPPPGMTATRFELLAPETEKCGTYHEHVASYNAGIEYLRFWETVGHPPLKQVDALG